MATIITIEIYMLYQGRIQDLEKGDLKVKERAREFLATHTF